MEQLAQKAIRAALQGRWEDAESLNREVLRQNPSNTDTLNRLARAQSELGKIPTSINTYKKVLRLDKHNAIAQKALARLEKLRKGKKGKAESRHHHGVESSFLEEPGKSKTVSLIHLGDESVVTNLDAGQALELTPHAHRVSVQNEEGKYVGRLPDDLSRRIISLTRAGNEYKTLVKTAGPGNIKVFIKEIRRGPQVSDTPSFPTEKQDYVSFTSPDLVHEERPETSSLEEEEES